MAGPPPAPPAVTGSIQIVLPLLGAGAIAHMAVGGRMFEGLTLPRFDLLSSGAAAAADDETPTKPYGRTLPHNEDDEPKPRLHETNEEQISKEERKG
ncbi:hypothetical protein GH714_005459 [Hevea brasiliensis]|uniref:Uncharacterized protein n=1 Tax=Hevea brasiliensis TaxID=3981 RepID=A0A6A6KZB0_HEVBR|nr:hypothetical protein GH714_005459 [Hevea brasiliensis]